MRTFLLLPRGFLCPALYASTPSINSTSSPSTPIIRRVLPQQSVRGCRCGLRFQSKTAWAVGYQAHTTGDSPST